MTPSRRRRVLYVSAIMWVLSWAALSLEIFRWHHVTRTLRLQPPPAMAGYPPPRPGTFLILVLVTAAFAPVTAVLAAVLEVVRRRWDATLLAKVEDHNRYNGYVFSVLEFGAVAVVTAGLGVYYLVAGRLLLALVAAGIAVNCLLVAVIGLRARSRGEAQIGHAGLADAQVRRQIRAERPHLLRDTFMITGLVLVPYAAALVLLLENRRPPG